MPRRYYGSQGRKYPKRLKYGGSNYQAAKLSLKDGLTAILAGFGVGALLVLTSFLFFYSAIVRIAVLIGLSSWKNYRRMLECSKRFAILSFVKIVGEHLGSELAVHFIEQRRRWKEARQSKLKVRFMSFLLFLDILWAVTVIKMNEVFFRQGIH